MLSKSFHMLVWNLLLAIFSFSTYLTLHAWPHYNLICLKCGEVDKPLFGWHFVWVLCHFHAFSWQNSCLDTHFVLEKYSRSMEWKSWKVHALWRFEQLCHLTTIVVSSTAMAKWWHPFWTMSAFDDNYGKLIMTIVHTMTIVVIPQCPKASVSQVSDHDHGGVQHNCSVFSGWYL